MTLYEIINLSIIFGLSLRDLDWLMYFIFPAVLIVIFLYQTYINEKRSLNKTEIIIGAMCLLLAAAISMIMILDWLMYFMSAVVGTVIFLYHTYINDIKKRSLNITEKIIGTVCLLLAAAISMMAALR